VDVRRIAVTGGPGGGKTSVWRALAKLHAARICPVPEVATLMFQHVFPMVQHDAERRAVQRSIYRVQHDLEGVHAHRLGPNQCLLTDRGTPDGGAYWPDGHLDFFVAMGTDQATQLARYDAVLFLETAAAGGHSIREGNPTRTEDAEAAVAIDRRLQTVWSPHPRFERVPFQPDLREKVRLGSEIVSRWLDEG